MTEYSETEGHDDAEGRVLNALADGMPYAFTVATALEPELSLRLVSEHGVEVIRALLVQTLKALPGGMDKVSDGHHTFGELYDHRRALTAVLAAGAGSFGDAWRSIAHHPDDDSMFPGYFIVGIELPTGMITYHYELEHWDDFAAVPELKHAPKWDGAAPGDSVTRLLEAARSVAGERNGG